MNSIQEVIVPDVDDKSRKVEVIVPGVDDNSRKVELKFLVENDPTLSISTSFPHLCRQSQCEL